jgi:phosphatidylglycerophosphatase A
MMRDPVLILATGFGSGLAPRAPGTAGSVVGVILYLAVADLSLPFYFALLIVLSCLGCWICDVAARKLGVPDAPSIVFDEIVGVLITLAGTPIEWPWLLLGFALFRFFDILKPWPIRWLDKNIHGGVGIMLDDLLAGVFALVLLQAAQWAWIGAQ